MTRNPERELGYAYVKGKNLLMFASEWPMLSWLAWRNSIDLEDIEDVTPYDILEFPVDNPRARVITKAEAWQPAVEVVHHGGQQLPFLVTPPSGTMTNTKRRHHA